jgi:hypothetical protein
MGIAFGWLAPSKRGRTCGTKDLPLVFAIPRQKQVPQDLVERESIALLPPLPEDEGASPVLGNRQRFDRISTLQARFPQENTSFKR